MIAKIAEIETANPCCNRVSIFKPVMAILAIHLIRIHPRKSAVKLFSNFGDFGNHGNFGNSLDA